MSKNSIGLNIIGIYIASVFLFGDSHELVVFSNAIFAIMVCVSLLFGWEKNIPLNGFVVTLFLYTLLLCFSYFWAIDSSAVMSDVQRNFIFIILVISIVQLLIKDEMKDTVFIWIMLTGPFMLIYLFSIYGSSLWSAILGGQRIGDEVARLNTLGMYASTIAIVSFFYFFVRKKKICLVSFACGIVIMLASGSRRSFLMLIVCMLLCVFLGMEGNNRTEKRLKTICLLGIMILLFFQVLQLDIFSGVLGRFSELSKMLSSSDNNYSRVLLLRYGWDSFLKHPILGIGSGNSHIITMQVYANWKSYLHNNYLEMLVNLGIVGFLVYYSIYAYLIKELVLNIKYFDSQYSKLGLILLISQLVSDIAVTSYCTKIVYIIFAIGYAIIRNERNKFILENEQ